MKEAFIKNTIDGFCRFYGYGVIQLIKCSGLSSEWALVKNLDVDSKRVIIFVNDIKGFSFDALLIDLRDKLNCEDVELVKIYTLDNNELYENDNEFVYEGDVVTVDCVSNKLLAYGFKCEEISQELANLMNYYNSKKNENNIGRNKPWVTYGLIFINVLMYVITAFLSGNILDSNINVLVLLGAKYNELIAAGEYYRLVTCMFLHGGIMHLVLNMYALNSIGPLVERVYGKLKYIIIYFASGILSSFLSYVFSEGVSIGASGAIFGLLGTTLVFAISMRKDIGKSFVRNISSVIIINLFIGFTMPNIDNFGHIGGLIGGAIAALIFNIIRKK